MARHFTQSATYRDFKLSDIKSEAEAFLVLSEFAFGDRKTFACPICGSVGDHYLRKTRKQWRCRDCDSTFSPTSGTALHKRKISCLTLVRAILMYSVASNGKSASQAGAELGVDTRTAWLLFSKLRECLVQTWDTSPMSGEVQADGGHFCGKPRRANHRKKIESVAVNARLRGRKAALDPTLKRSAIEPWNAEKLKKRRVVLAVRQMAGTRGAGSNRTMVAVLKKEDAASANPFIRRAVTAGSGMMTDSGGAFSALILDFDLRVVNHSKEYSTPGGVNNNQAESYMSRLRRGEFGVFRGMRPRYFLDYCVEMAWREDLRRKTIKEKMLDIFRRVRQCQQSPSFCGYYQGTRRLGEWTECPWPLPEGVQG